MTGVQVVGHRGSSEGAEEHTLAAYRRAIDDGADALECDVRLTADGHLVCVHDRRVDRVSDGRGPVSALELVDLAQLRFGARRHRCAPTGRRRAARGPRPGAPGDEAFDPGAFDTEHSGVLTLHRLLELVADAGRPVELAVETKHPTRYAGLVERRLIESLDRFGWAHPRRGRTSPVRVMSFAAASLRRVRRLAPSLDLVLLMQRMPYRRRDGTLPVGCSIVGVDVSIVRRHPGYVARAHAHGHRVHVWTVNEPAEVDLCRRLAVDAVITDLPGAVRRHLEASDRP